MNTMRWLNNIHKLVCCLLRQGTVHTNLSCCINLWKMRINVVADDFTFKMCSLVAFRFRTWRLRFASLYLSRLQYFLRGFLEGGSWGGGDVFHENMGVFCGSRHRLIFTTSDHLKANVVRLAFSCWGTIIGHYALAVATDEPRTKQYPNSNHQRHKYKQKQKEDHFLLIFVWHDPLLFCQDLWIFLTKVGVPRSPHAAATQVPYTPQLHGAFIGTYTMRLRNPEDWFQSIRYLQVI